MSVLGVDFGGSFIKSGTVYTGGSSQNDPIPTPEVSTPENVFYAIKPLVHSGITKVGMAIPCAVKNNRALTSTNISNIWQTIDLQKSAQDILGIDCTFINDADAAAVAEMSENIETYGLTILLTFGTGIGAAMIYNGTLIPNMEFGRMAMPRGIDTAEDFVSAKMKTYLGLNWDEYAYRMNLYLDYVCDMFQPDNLIIGGGVSDDWDQWGHLLKAPCNIHKARLGNNAGFIGAAHYANGFAN